MNSTLGNWHKAGEFLSIQPHGIRLFYRDFYRDSGNKQASPENTLLLLHGYPESSHSFHKVIEGLQGHFQRIVVFDMPGYGASDKPGEGYSYSLVQQADAALQLWRALDVRGGHVLSHDMGTSVLTELLARHSLALMPAWFETGFLSATFTNGSMVLELADLRVMQRVLLSGAGAMAAKLGSLKIFAQQVRSGHGLPDNADGALADEDIDCLWQANCLQQGHRKTHLVIRYLNDRKQYEKTRWLPALAEVANQLPVHICWGESDAVARLAIARHLKNKVCPQAVLTTMPGVGHFCQLGSPDAWLQGVLGFYKNL